MARPLRIEFPNAIYHVMARGNGRQRIFHADADYQRMTDGLAKTVSRTGWQVFAFVWMPNHIHLFVRTPKPNLSVGMQYLLSGYANWYAKRLQRAGHLFQGRFKAELVEDESYFWRAASHNILDKFVREPVKLGVFKSIARIALGWNDFLQALDCCFWAYGPARQTSFAMN